MSNKKRAWLCAIGCIIMVAFSNTTSTVLNLFLTSICESLNCTAITASYIFTFSSFSGMVISFIVGTMISTKDPKWICALGGGAIMLIFLGFAFSKSIYILWLLGLFYGMGAKVCGVLTSQILISSWFKKGATFLMSLSMSVSTGVSVILSPICATLITSIGYRDAAMYMGIFMGGVIITVSLLLISKLPDAYHMEPIECNIGSKKATEQASSNSDQINTPIKKLF